MNMNTVAQAEKITQRCVAETFESNVRSKIIKKHLNAPAFYDKIAGVIGWD